jgi:hypothetical protein
MAFENIRTVFCTYQAQTVRILTTLLFCFLFENSILSQDTTSRITIIKGAYPSFIFNSIKKYQDGIEYNGFTRFQVYYLARDGVGDPDVNAKWRLKVRPIGAGISGDTKPPLDFNIIEISVNSAPAGSTINVGWHLVVGEVTLVEDGSNQTSNGIIEISYRIGDTNPLLGTPPDFYTADLEFILETDK